MKDRHLYGAGAAACAACCAPPLIGLLGLAGFAATAATVVLVGVAFGLVVGAASVLALVVRRRPATRGTWRPVHIAVAPPPPGADDQHDTTT